MGGYDLLHDVESQNVRCVVGFFRLAEGGQHSGRVARAVVGEAPLQLAAHAIGPDSQLHRGGVVPDAVAQQVLHGAAQQGLIHRDAGLLGGRGLFQREGVALPCRAVAEAGHQLPQQGPGLRFLPTEGLGPILQACWSGSNLR